MTETLKYNRLLYKNTKSLETSIQSIHRCTGATTAMLLGAISEAMSNPGKTHYVEMSMTYMSRRHEFDAMHHLIQKLELDFLDVKLDSRSRISITYNLFGTVEKSTKVVYNIID